ncbi:MAG TPA: DUF6496 domain-containing protein [Ignavibacteria bacterium]|nr:DUF6496 domain-containing protein [Ignavibacteria bacterium]
MNKKLNSKLCRQKKNSKRKYGKAASKYVESAVRREKKGTLKSGRSGKTVKSRKQAIAIGLSEAREKGAKVPKKKSTSKKSSSKNTPKKSSGRKSTRKKSSKK